MTSFYLALSIRSLSSFIPFFSPMIPPVQMSFIPRFQLLVSSICPDEAATLDGRECHCKLLAHLTAYLIMQVACLCAYVW